MREIARYGDNTNCWFEAHRGTAGFETQFAFPIRGMDWVVSDRL